jgi:DNA-binding beta-propeller fold protein YncE
MQIRIPRLGSSTLVFGAICAGVAQQAQAGSETPLQSAPLALTADDNTLVNVNPESNTLTAFDVSDDSPAKLFTVKVGGDPTSVDIQDDGPGGRRAFVALALDGKVAIVDLDDGDIDSKLKVGAEPSAVLVSANGTRLYVANAASSNVMVFNATLEKPTLIAVIDLASAGGQPRALALTDDGDTDDDDETLFAAVFYGQLRSGKTALDEGQDDQKEGRVVAISTATNTIVSAPNPITLGPIANSGFNSNGKLCPATGTTPAVASTNPQTFTTATGAYPNQLAGIALQPGTNFAYVVSTAASPNGPLRFNHMVQGLVSVFDTTTRLEVTASQTDPSVVRTAPLNLNRGINLATTPEPKLFLSNPVSMAWRPNGADAWIAVQNADLVVRLTADVNGAPTVGSPLVAGPSSIVRVDLQDVSGTDIAGKAPRGIAINRTGTRAYVSNFVSRSITVIDIENGAAPAIVGTAKSAKLPKAGSEDAMALLGAELFYTGRGPEGRMSSEAWGGCIVCHPNGRSDNVTWMFDAGPRQTISLDAMFSFNNPDNRRILNWSGVRDENQDFELNTRGVFAGRGLIDDDRLFLAIGGASGATPTDSALVEQFHQVTGGVTTTNDLKGGATLPSLLAGRRDFAIATLADDRVFIFGGRSGSGQGSLVSADDAVLEFDPRKNKLKKRSSAGLTVRHSSGAAAVITALGPRIYVIGGYESTNASTSPSARVQEYDPATNSWRDVANLPTPVAQFGVAVAGGHNTAEPLQLVHVIAGNTGTEGTPSLVNLSPVQRYQADPAGVGAWTNLGVSGLTLRRNHGAAVALRGASSRIFVIGGQDAGGTVLNTVEEYVAQNATFVASTHTAMPAPRSRFGIASSLSTNQIYVVGGVDGAGADAATVFEYTIANNGPIAGPSGTPSGAWTTKSGALSTARSGLGLSNPPGVTNFLPVANAGRDPRQDAIVTWIQKRVRPARAPVAADDLAALAGKTLFEQEGLVVADFSCATCHGGAKWSRSFVAYDGAPSPDVGPFGAEKVIGAELRETAKQPSLGVLSNVGTFTLIGRTNEIRFNGADISQAIAPLGANGFNLPSMLSLHETAPYFYSGLATSLEQVLDGSQDGNGGVRHHFVADAGQRANLIAFLRSIDDRTKPFK